ncbi:MAG: hypothetical protein NC253_11805 [Ruminococcus sp.]|nr:hypothetical protein [Ruminococcus sp.]MCM1382872.1 hypothetical protein [Muribaculaceae bacterium]MCM1479906.1 hypothetical protein [Muribaculaceae bacterium]
MNELYNKIEEILSSQTCTIEELFSSNERPKGIITIGELFEQMRELGYTDEEIGREFTRFTSKNSSPTNEYI